MISLELGTSRFKTGKINRPAAKFPNLLLFCSIKNKEIKQAHCFLKQAFLKIIF
jgi:hypothetical protein